MSESEKPRRFYNRDEIRDVEISEERKAKLRAAFEQTVAAERIHNCVAATFEIEGEISNSGVVVSSQLDRENVFDPVGSYSGGEPEDQTEFFANATVKDPSTGYKLAAHVSQNKILVSRKNDAVTFESFRDYILYLESALHVTLTPILGSD